MDAGIIKQVEMKEKLKRVSQKNQKIIQDKTLLRETCQKINIWTAPT